MSAQPAKTGKVRKRPVKAAARKAMPRRRRSY